MRGRGASVGRKGRVRMAIRGDVGPGGVGGRQCEGRQGKAWQGKADRVKGWGAEPRMVVYRRAWCWRVVQSRVVGDWSHLHFGLQHLRKHWAWRQGHLPQPHPSTSPPRRRPPPVRLELGPAPCAAAFCFCASRDVRVPIRCML